MKFKEYIKENPEFKKFSKELQKQRYELYDQQRQSNIERCKLKRIEIIANSKKIKQPVKKYNIYGEEEDEDDEEIRLDLDYKLKLNQRAMRNSESYNYLRRINHSNDSAKRKKSPPRKKILVTASSYIMNDSKGMKKTEIAKKDLDNFVCLKEEKKKLDKKAETKDDHFMRYLKVQLNNAKKIKETKDKIESKDKNIENFLKIKGKGKKIIDNERYQDKQDINERKKIYEKMSADFDQKLFLLKKQQEEKDKLDKSTDKIAIKNNKNKIKELDEQIKEYEKKNLKYQQKINDLFELKDPDEMKKKINERVDRKKEKVENKKETIPNTVLMKKKFDDMEEKLEIEKYKREKALMNNMNKFQEKINKYLKDNEERKNKFKQTMNDLDKERKEKNNKKEEHLKRISENLKNNEKEREERRQKILNKIEANNLKDFAIKQEKDKMIAERKKIIANSRFDREKMKLRIQEIIDGENSYNQQVKNDKLLNKLFTESNKKDEEENDQ